ncbi:HlyD family secretion protein [Vibrio sp.]|nr:HlyD family secretion protein [Vibrio sp.]
MHDYATGGKTPSDDNNDGLKADWEKIRDSEPKGLLRVGLWTMLGFILVNLIWASVSEVETYVVSQGRIKPTVPNTVIQSQIAGRLETFHNQNGFEVKQGELLAVLNDRVPTSDLKSTELQLANVSLRIQRLEAELNQTPLQFNSQMTPAHTLELSLYRSRLNEMKATLKARKQKIDSLDIHVASLKQELIIMEDQEQLLDELLDDKKARYEAEKDRYRRNGPRKEEYITAQSQLLEAKRQRSSLISQISGLESESKNTATELERYLSQYQSEISNSLVQATNEFIELKKRLVAYEERLKHVEIRAPFDAIVLRYADKAVGTSVQQGDFLFELVPIDSPMEVELDLSPQDISRISFGDPVSIKLSTLPFTKYGTVQGTLRQVSEDTVETEIGGRKTIAFRGWASIDSLDELRNVPQDFRLQPGLTLEANIQTGKRTLMSYLIYPVAKAIDESFREP